MANALVMTGDKALPLPEALDGHYLCSNTSDALMMGLMLSQCSDDRLIALKEISVNSLKLIDHQWQSHSYARRQRRNPALVTSLQRGLLD